MARHYHKRRKRKYLPNPLGVPSGDMSAILYGSAGYVAARALPAMVLPSRNSGIMGYALNAATAVAMRLVIGGARGDELFVGGAIATVSRIVSDQFGAKIAGLSGDPAFTLGAYWNSYFAVPTVSDPYGRVAASPYPMPALPAATRGMSGPGPRGGSPTRFASGRFG